MSATDVSNADIGNQSMASYQSNEDIALVHHLELSAFKHLSKWIDSGAGLLQVSAHGFENWRNQAMDPYLKYHLGKISAICFEFYSHRQRLNAVLEKMQLEHVRRSYSWMSPIKKKDSNSPPVRQSHTIEINNLPGKWSPERLRVLSNACGSPDRLKISTLCNDCLLPHVPSSLQAVYATKEEAHKSILAVHSNTFGQCVSPPRAAYTVNQKVSVPQPEPRRPPKVFYSDFGESLDDRIARLSNQRAEEICREFSRSQSQTRQTPQETTEDTFEPLY